MIKQLHKKGAVEATVAHEDERFLSVMRENKAQNIPCPRKQLLQRFSSWKSHKMWCAEPFGKEIWILGI